MRDDGFTTTKFFVEFLTKLNLIAQTRGQAIGWNLKLKLNLDHQNKDDKTLLFNSLTGVEHVEGFNIFDENYWGNDILPLMGLP